jgi:hypothetical protein
MIQRIDDRTSLLGKEVIPVHRFVDQPFHQFRGTGVAKTFPSAMIRCGRHDIVIDKFPQPKGKQFERVITNTAAEK